MQNVEMKNLGTTIKKIRDSFMLTQEQLGEKAGISGSHVCQIENGNRDNPSMKTIYGVSQVLK